MKNINNLNIDKLLRVEGIKGRIYRTEYSKCTKFTGRNEKLDSRSHKRLKRLTFHLYTSTLTHNLCMFDEDMTF